MYHCIVSVLSLRCVPAWSWPNHWQIWFSPSWLIYFSCQHFGQKEFIHIQGTVIIKTAWIRRLTWAFAVTCSLYHVYKPIYRYTASLLTERLILYTSGLQFTEYGHAWVWLCYYDVFSSVTTYRISFPPTRVAESLLRKKATPKEKNCPLRSNPFLSKPSHEKALKERSCSVENNFFHVGVIPLWRSIRTPYMCKMITSI